MSLVQNEKQSERTQSFMESIYRKVETLKLNLNQYRANDVYLSHVNQLRNPTAQPIGVKLRIQKYGSQPTLKLTKINQQSKLNRYEIIINQRTSFQGQFKNGYSTVNYTSQNKNKSLSKPFSPFKKHQASRFRSISSIAHKYNIEKTKFNENSKRQPVSKRKHFEFKSISQNQHNKLVSPNSHIKIKQFEVGNSRKNMNKLIKFLDRNELNTSRRTKLKQYQKNDMAEMHKLTNNQEYKQFVQPTHVVDDLVNHLYFLKLKQQKLQLEQNSALNFRPLGSANSLRKSIDQQCIENQSQNKDECEKVHNLGIESNVDRGESQKSKYLKKGNRLRQMLFKKLLKEDQTSNRQMVYVKQYDQWVPSKLLSQNRKQLQKYLQLLLGQKKQLKVKKVNLNDIDILYL